MGIYHESTKTRKRGDFIADGKLAKPLLITLTVFTAIFLFFAPSWGSNWAISPHIAIVEEYNDNILYSGEGEELDDWVTYLKPRVQGTYSTEKVRLSLDSGLGIQKYRDNDALDTTDHDHRMALSCLVSKTLSLQAGAYFREDTTLETELTEEGLLVRNREDRRRFGGDLGFIYLFSNRISLSGNWTETYTEYPEDPEDFDDFRSYTLHLAPQYVLGPKTRLFLRMAYTKTEYDRRLNPSISNFNIRPSFRHDFAEHYYISGGAGYSYTERETDAGDEHSDNFVFDLAFHRDWQKVSMELVARRDQYSSIDARSVERDRLTLTGTYRLGARFRTSVAASFGRNHVEVGNDSDYYTATPALTYDLTPNIQLRANVDYSEYRYEDASTSDRDRFTARLLLDLNWPGLLRGE